VRLLLVAALTIPLGLPAPMPVPPDNPITPERVELGRRLFSDTRLSRDGTISCASCHDPARAFTKPESTSPGVFGRRGRRNAPALVNLAWANSFFWDARAFSLEDQVLKPIEDPNEMDLPVAEAASRAGVTTEVLSRSLATYVRTLVSGDSAYDRFVHGDRTVMTSEEQDGYRLFRGRGNCMVCHDGPNLTDGRLHNTGIAWAPADDDSARAGRFVDEGAFAISHEPAELGAFKTPTLRDIALTAPYMHDGSLTTLEDVVEFYDRGGRQNPNLDTDMERLDFSPQDKRALVAFMRTLTGARLLKR